MAVFETPARIEPCQLPSYSEKLANLVSAVTASATAWGGRLHPLTAASLADLVRVMNCYYSNLIEGHDTHPRDIERALLAELETEPERRNLQLEARAHIDVQQKIDAGAAPRPATSIEFIRWVHQEFCRQLPEQLLTVSNPRTGREEKVVPGELRHSMVKVGRHIPPAPEDLAALLERFASAYGNNTLSRIQRIVGVAASHHRLLWIHPFADGNGRVTRLYPSETSSLSRFSSWWIVSRGRLVLPGYFRDRRATPKHKFNALTNDKTVKKRGSRGAENALYSAARERIVLRASSETFACLRSSSDSAAVAASRRQL